MTTKTTTTWSIDTVEAAMAAPTYTEVGYLTMGFGQATLPDAADGAPVSVPAEVALEAITQHGGLCWVDESGHLVGWPEDDSGPEPAAEPVPSTLDAWTLQRVQEAMDAPDRVEIGHVTLGAGAATLPDAADGAPVSVSAAVVLEAIQRYQGDCWVAHRPTGGYLLLGEDDPVAPEALPGWRAQRVLGAPLAEEIAWRGLTLWWHPATGSTLWLGVVYSDGRAAGVDARDYHLRVGWVDGVATASAFVDEAPAWACPAIERAREVLGV